MDEENNILLYLSSMDIKLKLTLLSVGLFVVGIGFGVWGGKSLLKLKNSKTQKLQTSAQVLAEEQTGDYVDSDQNVVEINSDSYNVLLMGHGGDGHSGGYLMDSIILLHINLEEKSAALISIPRDFWFSGHKINADPSIKDAVAAITGLSVPDYISVDFNSFIGAINSIGGIDIDIQKEYTDNFYPVRGLENELCGFSPEKVAQLHQDYSGFNLEKQFECRYETIHFDVGTTHIDGETALKYVRSRHGDGDFGRSGRQFTVLKALVSRNLSFDDVKDLTSFVKTNIDISKVKSLMSAIGNPLGYEISSVHLSDANVLVASKSSAGAYILIPRSGIGNFSEIQNFIAK
jgi:anionic cell wall polymer biosynthesis LytR-Cps2A-Psr (LCP) family protein